MNDRLAQARETVLHPEMVINTPAAVESAWSRLKEAQGHPITIRRAGLLEPRHLVAGDRIGTVACINQTRERVIPQIHAHAAQRGLAAHFVRRMIGAPPTSGDAA